MFVFKLHIDPAARECFHCFAYGWSKRFISAPSAWPRLGPLEAVRPAARSVMAEQIVRLNRQQQVALDEAAEAEIRRHESDPKQALTYMMMLNVQLP